MYSPRALYRCHPADPAPAAETPVVVRAPPGLRPENRLAWSGSATKTPPRGCLRQGCLTGVHGDGLTRSAISAAGAAGVEDLAAGFGGHARTEPVTALAHEVRGLEGAFRHLSRSGWSRGRSARGICDEARAIVRPGCAVNNRAPGERPDLETIERPECYETPNPVAICVTGHQRGVRCGHWAFLLPHLSVKPDRT